MYRLLVNTFALCAASAAHAGAFDGFIDFEMDSQDDYNNGFISTSDTLSNIRFSHSTATGVRVFLYDPQSIGNGLAANGDFDESSYLEMSTITDVTFIELLFGNDDPADTNPGDTAVLTGFRGGVQVAQSIVEMNRDDLANQSISIADAIGMDFVTFRFDVGLGQGLTEVIDNVSYTIVPAPAGVALIGYGALGMSRRRR